MGARMIKMPDTYNVRKMRGWDIALMAVCDGMVGEPFVWNRTNCAALAAGSVDAMCGTSLLPWQFSIRLTDARALILAKKRVTRAVLNHIGCVRVDPPYAQRGDILLAYDGEMECAHVCIGLHSLSSSKDRGVHLVTTESVLLGSIDLEVYRCQ